MLYMAHLAVVVVTEEGYIYNTPNVHFLVAMVWDMCQCMMCTVECF